MKRSRLCARIYRITGKIKSGIYKCFWAPIIRRSFDQCGKNVVISKNSSFSGIENIYVGNNVYLSKDMLVLTTRAKLYIGNDVMIAPNVTIITGDHRIDLPNRTMISVGDSEKLPENDQDVVIEDDVWIGANVTILKGVTIHKGSVISAGAVVVKDVESNTIVGGVPAKLLKRRFE